MMGFETLTLVPFDRRLIDAVPAHAGGALLAQRLSCEVRGLIEPLLKGADRPWLRHATAPLG